MTIRQKIRNNAAAIFTASAMLVAGTAVVLSKNCGKNKACKRTPMTEGVRKNDGICDQRELYPFKRDKNMKVLKKNGKPIPNPYYSKADCFKGDNVCDNATSVKDLMDPANEKVDQKSLLVVNDNTIKYKNGITLKLPLEGPDSRDCRRAAAIENPCSEDPNSKLLDRPLIKMSDPDTPLVQRTQENLERIFENPSLVKPGNNYVVVVPNLYKETCNVTLSVCKPDNPVECYCPNNKACVPSTCGNGKLDKGEQCDPKHSKRRYRAKRGHYCSPYTCRWVKVKKRPKQVCGNGKREGTEQCDKNDDSRCGSRGCTSSCTCKPKRDPPKPVCGNKKVEKGEQCDPPGSKCGTNGTCTSSCQCKAKPPPTKRLQACQTDRTVSAVKRSVRRHINGRALYFSRKYQHTGSARVTVRVRIIMSGGGSAESYTVSSSCKGSEDACPVRKLSASQNTAAFGSLRLSSIKINPQGNRCVIRTSRPIASSGN